MPSNADIFQTSFLNGLSMATAQESGKLAAMEQAQQLQYGLQTKRLDFQLNLLKMQEAQAAQAVEMRMAQDEHQLKLKDYALRAEESQMRRDQMSVEMETRKVSTAAGVAISGLENRLAQAGVDPSRPEFLLAQVSAVQQGALAGVDERVRNMVGSTLNAKLRTTQETLYNDGMATFDKLTASRTVAMENPETGVSMTERMFGVADKGKLIAVADRFRQAASLGHEPSQRMYGEVMALVDGVGQASKPGVTDAAKAAGDTIREKYGNTTTPLTGGFSGAVSDAAVDQTIASLDRADTSNYVSVARTKLVDAQKQFLLAGDRNSAKVIADRLGKLDLLQTAALSDTGEAVQYGVQPPPSAMMARTGKQALRSPAQRELAALAGITDPQGIVDELDAIFARRQKAIQY